MNTIDLKRNCRYWCWWMHRYLLYKGKTSNGMYLFEDFGDELFCFTEDQVRKLECK